MVRKTTYATKLQVKKLMKLSRSIKNMEGIHRDVPYVSVKNESRHISVDVKLLFQGI